MDQMAWKQITVDYSCGEPEQRERRAIERLARVMPAAEAAGHITSWWFIRKGAWRIRYLLASESIDDPLRPLLTNGVAWITDIYEPEVHAFGGAASMDTAHDLFHHDSRHLITYLVGNPGDRREQSLVLCTALMRAAGLDVNEQGDVWARIADQRAEQLDHAPHPDPPVWAAFTNQVRQILLSAAQTGTWQNAFEDAGHALRTQRASGQLDRGIRAVVALHIIFHWNRIGLRGRTQATLSRAASQAIFGFKTS